MATVQLRNTETQYSAPVTFIGNAINNQTGTIEMRGTFPNEDRRLWPGQFVNVTVTLGSEENATVIPASMLQTTRQRAHDFAAQGPVTGGPPAR